jgi:thioester reductase-like protein
MKAFSSMALCCHKSVRTIVYKTGDLARYLPDGNIEYLGRIDNQVKIRGFRVELGEIEAAINQHPQVSQVTVIDSYVTCTKGDQEDGNKQLVAYIVPQLGQEISSAEIRVFLKELLPNYMVPAAVVCLAEFPVTPNGKIDRRALPAIADDRKLAANMLPKTEMEQTISKIWEEILGLAQVSIQDNFFEFGGNSLLAIQMMSQLNENFQIDLPVRQIFANPTIAELTLTISSTLKSAPIAIADPDDTVDFWAEVKLDPTIGLGALTYHHVTTPLAIFLSGATGFVGAFLLAELLQETTADIYCLVRATSIDAGKQRLQANMEKYLLWKPAFATRIVVILGDLNKPLLGLTHEQFQGMASKIDAIYHNGALVNHAYPYSTLKATNVLGTEEILRLASQVKIKPVHFLSTVSIFEQSGYNNKPIIYENDPLESFPEGNGNGYVQSKWVAEKLVKIAQDRGLPCSIYRIARASWHSQTGVWNVNDIFYKLLQGCVQLNSFSDIDMSENLTPVDYLAKVLVCLSQKPDSVGQAFNLHSPHFTNLSTIAQGMGDAGYFLPTLPAQTWLDKLTEFMQGSSEHALYSYIVMSGISPQTLNTENQGVDSTEKLDRQNVLNDLANTPLVWPEIDTKLIQKFLSVWISQI